MSSRARIRLYVCRYDPRSTPLRYTMTSTQTLTSIASYERPVAIASEPEATSRELDHRCNDGIDVKLLWNPVANQVSITVKDVRSGASLAFEVDPADARGAFHHPYPYVSRHRARVGGRNSR